MGAIKNIKLSALKEKHNGRIFIETGSGYGTGIYEALRSNFDLVLSVEIDKEQTELLQKVFRFDQKVQIFNALSRDFLSQILLQININTPCVIFLDAHFPGESSGYSYEHEKDISVRLPLEQEIEIIRQASLDLVEMSENKNKFNNSFKRLVLKDGNKFLIQVEINLNKLQNSIKNLVILLKEFSHY